jgi:ATP-binding cassette subfamily D (ALD) long-chain fatty acid import protein
VSKVTVHPTKPSTYQRHRAEFLKQPPGTNPASGTNNAATTANKVGVNKEFFRQLRAILRIIVPRKRSKEVVLILAHSSFLLLRTYLSLLVAKLDGKLVGDLVSRPTGAGWSDLRAPG